MSIDFTLPAELEELRGRVRGFIEGEVRPAEEKLAADDGDRRRLIETIIEVRQKATEWELWLPHMPKERGGLGLGPVGMASVPPEAAPARVGPLVLNRQAPA